MYIRNKMNKRKFLLNFTIMYKLLHFYPFEVHHLRGRGNKVNYKRGRGISIIGERFVVGSTIIGLALKASSAPSRMAKSSTSSLSSSSASHSGSAIDPLSGSEIFYPTKPTKLILDRSMPYAFS